MLISIVPRCTVPLLISGGAARACGPNSTRNKFCSTMPHSNVLMNTVEGGRLTSGKYATSETRSPMANMIAATSGSSTMIGTAAIAPRPTAT